MTAMTEADWTAEAVQMRRDHDATTAEIAEAVGKSESQVRKVLAKANAEAAVNGNRHGTVDAETSERIRRAAETGETQTDIVSALAGHDVPPEDDPQYEPPAPPEGEYEARLKGTQQTALDFGPECDIPVGGTLKIKSDKLASGFYGLGDVITGTFTARVVDVLGAERLQRASDEFRVQPQGHVALITDITLR